MADESDFAVDDFDHPHADLTNDLLPPHPADADDSSGSLSTRARLQRLSNTISSERHARSRSDRLGNLRSIYNRDSAGPSSVSARRPPSPLLASQRRMRFVLSQLGRERDDTQAGNPMDDRTAAARARQRRRLRSTDNRANDSSSTGSDFRNRRLQSPPFERTLQGNVDLLRRTSEDLRQRSEQLRNLLDLPIEDDTPPLLDIETRRDETGRARASPLLPFLENGRPGPVDGTGSDILRLRAASLRHLLDRGMADHVEAALPRPMRPFRADSQSQDQGRRKRRRLDDGKGPKRYERITYGVEGQVLPGKLKMDILSCDGEECGAQYGFDNRTYGVENILKDDDSVYCPTSQRANIVLTHYGQTTFHLERLVIKTPQKGYTNTLQEGLVFASLEKDEAFDRTASYAIFKYQDTHFAAMEKIAPDGRRYDPTAAGRQNHPSLVSRFHPFMEPEPELQDRGMTWMGPSHRNTYPSRFDIHDPGLCSEHYYDHGIDNAEKAFLSNGPHTLVRHTVDGIPTPAESESDLSLQELSHVPTEAGLGRYMSPPLGGTDGQTPPFEVIRRGSGTDLPELRDHRYHNNTRVHGNRSIYARMANRVRRHMEGRGASSNVEVRPPPPPPPPPAPDMPPWPRTSLISDDHSDTDADEHGYPGFPAYTPDPGALHSITPPPPPPPPPPVETSFMRSTSHMHTDKLKTEMPSHLVPNARFIMAKSTCKNKLVIEFDPPLASKYLLLKLWSPSRGGTIDVQSVECYGYAGMRFFPSVETV